MKIVTVVGTRPNIIKITQFCRVAAAYPHVQHRLLHTGQHYNHNMSDVFFEELGLPQPDYALRMEKQGVVSQLAEMMQGIEGVVQAYRPDLMAVVGDVNSTLAAALVANKMGIRLAHVESGLRSRDRSMPEENNRMLTDAITDLFFVTEEDGRRNLLAEGKPESAIHFVGNTMIDTLVAYDAQIRQSYILKRLGLAPQAYALMTMHRPGNVDAREGLEKLIATIDSLTEADTIVFPVHPRTLNRLNEFNLFHRIERNRRLILMEPAGYLDFQHLVLYARYVITDSGGIQEETTFRRVPCLTLRPNTERPSTITTGSNTLLGFDTGKIRETVASIHAGTYKSCGVPPCWDGKATERIFAVLNGQ
jgi:UDP-N-acetylglucosamine 2-epimerase (non-hydrolysing)